jgi:serine/threonine protein kinase
MSETGKASVDPYIGQVFQQGRYRVLKKLGAGGMGTVYLAEQVRIERKVALKVLRRPEEDGDSFIRRFHHEARLAGAINHARVVTIYDFGEMDDGNLFLVMEYVPGDTLKTVIQQERPLPVQRAVMLGLQLAEALRAVHQAGVLHRDVKPENVVVREGDEIKLMDFGIARQLDSEAQTELTHLTRTGMLIGSPQYMAPEQIDGRGAISQQTDIYAWGTVLYEMLAGDVPFAAPTWQAVLLKHLHEPPQPVRQRRPEVPPDVEQIVMQTLEKDPQQRQQNMGEVIAALRKVRWEEHGAKPQQVNVQPEAPTVLVEPQKADTLPEAPKLVSPPRPSRGLKFIGVGLAVLLVAGAVTIGARNVFNLSSSASQETKPIAVPPPPVKPPEATTSTKKVENDISQQVKDHLSTAAFYVEREQLEEAKAEFTAVLALDPDNKEARAGLDQMKTMPRVDEATARKIKDHLETAKFYLERDQADDAKGELETAQKLDPNNQDVITMLKRVHAARRRGR